ncbi:hypothetical protein LOTGIDRAFT_173716 [Lottia gigantea]|uniref:J domain-containing protein n=1 Tax=Lottia gigantea TaxID=225164 RepID=V4CCF3_LOTGI|nr:hypothetical protein LOTGIDRAFT_173716 [Lottia gigantea]ESO99574.1 hypothetical protein LOTGIDRAFT_173716 [Lottia gigantea]
MALMGHHTSLWVFFILRMAQEKIISTDLNLVKLYQEILTEVLQTNFTIPESTIDEIHNKILHEIKEKCRPLVERGVLFERDISRRLNFLVTPILQEAKRVNMNRKYSYNGSKCGGLCTRIYNPRVQSWTVLEGDVNTAFNDIRSWMKNMDNLDSSVIYGSWGEAGTCFDNIERYLRFRELFPKILYDVPYAPTPSSVHPGNGADVVFTPIHSELYMHNPEKVVPAEDIVLGLKTWRILIDEHGIRRTDSHKGITFDFPTCDSSFVDVEMKANIEYSLTKQLKVQTWAVVLSLGINKVFDKSVSKKISKILKLRVRIHSDALTLKEPIRVSISSDQARKFMESYNKFEQIMKVTNDNQSAALPPGAALTHLRERYPWIEFIETLRRGGVEAAMAMVKKKPEVIRNLPANENNIMGVAFEEIQIAKMMAEIVRNGSPIELIAGDGLGRFQYNGVEMPTPEYADAVFHNVVKDQYFAVQFKYSDDPRGLVNMIEEWNVKWSGRTPDPNLPEPLLHENVVLIGPNDVVGEVTNGNLGERIVRQFEQHEQIRYTPDDVSVMKQFLDDNSALLKDIVNSEDYNKHKRVQEDVKKNKNTLNTKEKNLSSLQEKLINLKQAKLDKGSGGNTEGIDKGISSMEKNINEKKAEISKAKNNLEIAENKLQISDKKMRTKIEDRITAKYRKEYIKKAALKEVALNVLVAAAVDGITALICTAGDEYTRYKNGEITLKQFTGKVLKSTAIATAKGAAFGLGLSSFNLAAQYAVANGSVYAGTLTTVAKAAGPVLMVGMFLKQSYDIVTAWNNGDLTTAGMKKAFARTVTAGGLSIGGMAAAGSLIGGLAGLFVGAGLAIAIGVGDYFLGDKLWSLFFKEDEEEQAALIIKKIEKIRTEVISSAYSLFGLTEYATLAEVKESYKVAILKYHPDKGGDAEIFNAVRVAYGLICSINNNSV